MPSASQETIDNLNEHLTVKDEDGRVVLHPALLLTLYVEDAYRREVREAIVSCCESYFELCGQHLRWSLNPNTKYMETFGKGKGSKPREWLLAQGEDESFSFLYHGAEHDRGASAFCLEGLGSERQPHLEVGYFRCSFPLLWFAERGGSFADVALKLCGTLRAVSGYGGIGVIESPDGTINQNYEPVVFQWAQRFPGLEADYPIEHSIWLTESRNYKGGIKGVNWLTVIGDRWLVELGGADSVAADLKVLDDRFVVHRFDGGILIQAGPKPQLGDVERGSWPELYIKLAKYLKPIRIVDHCPFHQAGPGPRFDLERSQAWLRRFDDR